MRGSQWLPPSTRGVSQVVGHHIRGCLESAAEELGLHAPESNLHAGQAAATSVSHNVCQLCLADPCGPTLQASLVKRAADRDSVPPSEVSAERRLSSAWQACGPRSHPMADARAAKRQTRLRLVPMHSRDAEKHPVDTKKNRLCRRFLNGSDGTRTRDLRRDRDTAPPCWPERRWTRFRGHTSVCYPMLLPNWWLCFGSTGAKRSKLPLLLGFESGASRNRTGDLLGAIQALSHLSYSPAVSPSIAMRPATERVLAPLSRLGRPGACASHARGFVCLRGSAD